jgi:hypothetical protein
VTIILGLNAYHGDASACLLRDGVLGAAAVTLARGCVRRQSPALTERE